VYTKTPTHTVRWTLWIDWHFTRQITTIICSKFCHNVTKFQQNSEIMLAKTASRPRLTQFTARQCTSAHVTVILDTREHGPWTRVVCTELQDKVKRCRTVLERRQRAQLSFIGLDGWLHHCNAWPVRCQTYGYLSERRASPPIEQVPYYTALWQRHTGINNLPRVITQQRQDRESNPRPLDRKCDILLRHCATYRHKNSSGNEIANVNFYAVRPEATRIRWNNAK